MLAKRIISAVIMVLLLAAVLMTGGWWLVGTALLLSVCVSFEFIVFAAGRSVVSFVLLPFMLPSLLAIGYGLQGVAIGVAFAWVLLLLIIILLSEFSIFRCSDYPCEHPSGLSPVEDKGKAFYRLLPALSLGLLYPGIFAAFCVYTSTTPDAAFRFAWVFAVAAASDTMAFFVGSSVGGPKLLPGVSPKKTVSGALAGLSAAILVSILYQLIAGGGDYLPAAGWGLVAGLFVQLGDLGESMCKRIFSVKDSGALIPGHGGVLDRVDGVLLAMSVLPFAFDNGLLVWNL
ncbi:MAG: phosphatidate cytidylyltransferase [bacterium]|nr:phosphatidate cytidylyltransferase [bacterium]